ncbi:MAG: hypothetical protein CMA12_06560 [Euryarchaeota archaeon]|nr:hypothetical protein [Euryarchaeota archaeon]OUW22105.1 MAG: hypothetical protein CBD33_03520 [Euryarchaeota archaeon TMED173]
MATQDLVAWICSALVILAICAFVFFELLKRWRVGLRLTELDETLLSDDGVSVEEITDAPKGSMVTSGNVAELIEESHKPKTSGKSE